MVTRVLRGSRMLPGVQKAQGDPNMVPSAKGSKNSFTERLKKISTFEAFLFCLFDFDIVLNPVLLAGASGNGRFSEDIYINLDPISHTEAAAGVFGF